MEISTFELLAKPIAPSGPPELAPVLRRVVQGYFLTISNLETFDVRYRIERKDSALAVVMRQQVVAQRLAFMGEAVADEGE